MIDQGNILILPRRHDIKAAPWSMPVIFLLYSLCCPTIVYAREFERNQALRPRKPGSPGDNRRCPQKEGKIMRDLLPDGEDLRRAVSWVSGSLRENPDQPVQRLVQEAVFTFDLSPKDADFLIMFFSERKHEP
jgi:hypothetical protein